MIKVILEGQTIQMPDEVARTDEGLIRALAPLYPDVANAEIARRTEAEQTIVTIVKRPGPKGSVQAEVLAALAAAPEEINPAVRLYLELQRVDLAAASPETLLALRLRIDQAATEGEAAIDSVRRSLKALYHAAPVTACRVPPGF